MNIQKGHEGVYLGSTPVRWKRRQQDVAEGEVGL